MPDALRIPADHPSLPGHFPGQPVVPAVLILDRVLGEIRSRHPQLTLIGVRKMKFLQRLEPDTPFQLECGPIRAGSLRFRCLVNGATLAEGSLLLRADAAQPGTTSTETGPVA